MAFSIPVMAATLAFVTYTSTSNNFDVAVIFASFALFQLLRQPLLFLPRALSAISDAHSALTRLEKVLHADVRREDETLNVDLGIKEAVRVEKATFEWEESSGNTRMGGKAEGKAKKGGKGKKEKARLKEEDDEKKGDAAAPFRVKDIDFVIPRGQLVAIVGPVGSGKVRTCRLRYKFLITDEPCIVESSTGPHWRNAEGGRQGNVRRVHRLLSSDCLDSELYTGKSFHLRASSLRTTNCLTVARKCCLRAALR
jgi:ABC-type multidrug transport system fused ATPase/permease subunit